MEGMRDEREVRGKFDTIDFGGVKPKRGKYKINSSIWMADGIVEYGDTTTN